MNQYSENRGEIGDFGGAVETRSSKTILFLFIAFVIFILSLTSCRGIRLGLPDQLSDAPAPTTVPLSPSAQHVLDSDSLTLPPGFAIEIFADGLSGPRMLTIGPDGLLYVAERGADRIVRLPDRDADGRADGVEPVLEGLDSPSSLAFHPEGWLYVAETDQVLRARLEGDSFSPPEIVISGLPAGGSHTTRTLLFSQDGANLYVSVGSTCNVCEEEDERRAAILRYDPEGGGETLFGVGLRNAVGITFRPGTDEIWATNNGRDWLGDDLPPETINLVRPGDDFGWPRCHAGRIIDPDFGGTDGCNGVAVPEVEMQAHSAPLGLTFYHGAHFPDEYHGDLFVAFHGSWNRREPTGYKIVRIPITDGAAGPVEDFVVGWLRADGSNWGRPVDVLVGSDGALFISDDGQGRIYRVTYPGG